MNKKIVKKYFISKKIILFTLSLLILLGTVIGSITPYLFGQVVDLIVSGNISGIFSIMLGMLFLEILGAILSALENYYGNKITLEISNEIKKDLLNRIIHMDMKQLDTYSKGELINRVEGDSSTVSSAYIEFITGILQIVISIIVALYFAILLSKELTVAFIIFFPILYGGTMILKKKYQYAIEKLKLFSDKFLGNMNEIFHNFEGLKSNVLENLVQKKIQSLFYENEKLSKRYYFVQEQMNFNQNVINSIFDCFMLGYAGILIFKGRLSIGNYVSFNQYVSILTQSAAQIMSVAVSLTACKISIERMEHILHQPIENLSLETKKSIEIIKKIEFEDVDFGYSDQLILKKLKLSIDRPGIYSIVGKNGSGKSTLIKLILRLYRQEDGRIYINDRSIESLNIAMLRKQISYIAKDTFLLNETIRYNITLGKEVDEKELDEICEKVDLTDYIESFPDKYEQIIGENGFDLSSGTKQKIAIARALIQETSLWLCDEITSDLDGNAESKIGAILSEIARYKIVILISHKLSMVEKSDIIFLMNCGKIVESGTNEELFKKSRLYKQIFDSSEII